MKSLMFQYWIYKLETLRTIPLETSEVKSEIQAGVCPVEGVLGKTQQVEDADTQ